MRRDCPVKAGIFKLRHYPLFISTPNRKRGYAHTMNGRPEAQPHMDWCPQREEYAAWWAETHPLKAG